MKTATKILGIGMTQANVPKVMSGEKTQTRRIIKNQPPEDASIVGPELYQPTKVDKDGEEYPGAEILGFYDLGGEWGAKVDYRPGDILYVKEALQRSHERPPAFAIYKTDCKVVWDERHEKRPWASDDGKPWKNKVIPARYMPRSAARTFIEITDVRCERVQEVSAEDVVAEGCGCKDCGQPLVPDDGAWACHKCEWMFTRDLVVLSFSDLWDDTNGKGAWERNDWVFAYTFKLVEANQ